MTYLIWYLVIGVVILIVVFISHVLSTKSESDFMRGMKSAIHPERKTLHYELLEKVVVPLLTAMLVLVFWPAAIYMRAKEILLSKKKLTLEKKIWSVVKDDLVRQMTVDEIELQERVIDPMGAVPDLPFGHLNTTWLRFKGNMEPQDSIWAFSARRTSDWERREILEGYVIVRADGIGPHFLTTRRCIEAATG